MESAKNPWRVVAFLAAGASVLGLVYLARTALTPVFIALLLTYLLDPLIRRMEGWRMSRVTAILIFAGALLTVLVFAGGFLILQAQAELTALYDRLPEYLERIHGTVVPFMKETFGITLPGTVDESVIVLREQVQSLDTAALKPATSILAWATSSTLALAAWVFQLTIIPVFLFYFLREWERMKTWTANHLPLAYRDYILRKTAQVDDILGAFIRGQLLICLILGVLYSLGLLIVGLDLAVVIGMTAGLLFIIPYLGTALGVVAATVMALLEHGLSGQLLGAWGVFAAVQLFEGFVLTPRIMGQKVGLPPVAVIIALMVGADLLGLVGMLAAVPVAAVINVFWQDGLARYRTSSYLKKDLEPPHAA